MRTQGLLGTLAVIASVIARLSATLAGVLLLIHRNKRCFLHVLLLDGLDELLLLLHRLLVTVHRLHLLWLVHLAVSWVGTGMDVLVLAILLRRYF